jgi:NarL family two-component system response regulator LiaR
MSEEIRLVIADDHAVVREGLRSFIETEKGLEIIGEAGNGREAVDLVTRLNPDVVLMDLVMPEMNGVEAIEKIRKLMTDVRVLVLTSFAEDEQVFAAVKAGAHGYLLKDSSPKQLLRAIRDVAEGLPSMDPTVARKLIQEVQRTSELPPTEEPLSERELDVLRHLAHGLSNQQIGDELFISERTVRTHVSNILAKLHLANRTQAALYALREGITDLGEAEP